MVHEPGALFPSPGVLIDDAKHVMGDVLAGVPGARWFGPRQVKRFRIVERRRGVPVRRSPAHVFDERLDLGFRSRIILASFCSSPGVARGK